MGYSAVSTAAPAVAPAAQEASSTGSEKEYASGEALGGGAGDATTGADFAADSCASSLACGGAAACIVVDSAAKRLTPRRFSLRARVGAAHASSIAVERTAAVDLLELGWF